MAPLHRAVALAEREHGPVLVGEQLDLDVARPFEIPLAEDGGVAERRLGLAGGGGERLVQCSPRSRTTRIPRPPPPAAALTRSGKPSSAASPVGTTGTPASFGDPLRGELVAAQPQRLGRRPDPREAGRADRLGEVGVLREEAVAGMDRVGAGALRGADVLLGVEVARDLDRLVGGARVEGAAIVRRGHRDRADPELAARAEDPDGDLAAVRHQEPPDRHSGDANPPETVVR